MEAEKSAANLSLQQFDYNLEHESHFVLLTTLRANRLHTVSPMSSKNTRSISINYFRQSASAFQLLLLLTCFAAFAIGNIAVVNGQAGRSDDDEQTGPEEVTLETKDKVQLVCTYFAPGKPPKSAEREEDSNTEVDPEEDSIDGKQVIPYIILHDWKSSRQDTTALAEFLSSQGNAVIIPDLRGHGDSIRVAGYDKEIDAADFKAAEIAAVMGDIERCKRFLIKKNNAGELNIDMLAVIAIGKTVPLATAWVVQDWSYAPYNSKRIKQGQDVKALIMISPEKKLGSFALNRVISAPIFSGSAALPTIVAWGTENSQAKEVLSIYNRLEKRRPGAKDQSGATKTLYKAALGNSLDGVKIGANSKLTKLWSFFHKTVSRKINDNLDKLPWQDRSKKK